MDEFDADAQRSTAHPAPAISGREVANYIDQMSREMSEMADACGLRRVAAGLRVIRSLCEDDLAEQGQS